MKLFEEMGKWVLVILDSEDNRFVYKVFWETGTCWLFGRFTISFPSFTGEIRKSVDAAASGAV